MDTEEVSQFIYVVGGPKMKKGRVCLAEVHPDHPLTASTAPNRPAENQAYIVKDDPRCGGAWVAKTSEVNLRLSRGFLKEATAPADAPKPSPSSPTATAIRAKELADNRELVATTDRTGGDPTLTKEEVEKIVAEEREKARADLRREIEEENQKAAADEAKKAADDKAKADTKAAKDAEKNDNK